MTVSEASNLRVETARFGPFVFRVGVNLDVVNPLLAKIEYGHRLFNSLPLLPGIAATIDKDTLVSSIHGTDTIEGGTLTEEETAQVLESPAEPKEERQRRIANLGRAYTDVQEYVARHQSSNGVLPIDQQFILQIHRTVSAGLDESSYRPGLYRDNPKGILTKVGDANHGGIYKPPQAHVDIALLMGHLTEWINSAEILSLSPLVRAPLLHYYLEQIHPFQDGNGRVGRLLEKAVLIAASFKHPARGLDRYYLDNIDEYFTLFNVTRNAGAKQPHDCNTVFVVFVLNALSETIERLHQRVSRMVRDALYLSWLGELLKTKHINSRQHAILDYLSQQHSKSIPLRQLKSQAWYKALYKNFSVATESRDWTGLFDEDLISKEPNGAVRWTDPLDHKSNPLAS